MSKENLHFDDQSKEAVFSLKNREHVLQVSLVNTHGSLGELDKAVETLA